MSKPRAITMSTSNVNKTESSSAAIYLTIPVILKFVQVILAIVCIGIAAHDLIVNFEDLTARSASVVTGHKLGVLKDFIQGVLKPVVSINHLFVDQMTVRIVYLAVSAIFLVISLIQVTWFPGSIFTGEIKSRIVSGVFYHLAGFGLHLGASLFLFQRINLLGSRFYNVDMMREVAIMGVVNGVLYFLSAIIALCSFIGNNIFERKSSPEELPFTNTSNKPREDYV